MFLVKKIACVIELLLAAGVVLALPPEQARSDRDTVEAHLAAARAATGTEYVDLLGLCDAPDPDPPPQPGPKPPPPRPDPPPRSQWHAEPVRVFDNLYFVGQTEYSAWVVTTSAGIILIDALWDYSVRDEVVGGLQKLGLDPRTIKYVLIRTLGDTTLTLFLTPGHTPGTISTLIPVKDAGKPHLAAEWGGTGFNFTVTADKPRKYWFQTYVGSARRFRDIVAKVGADVLISNRTHLDGSTTKLPALARRRPGDPHPYVVGNDSVKRYLTVAGECAQAGLLRLK